MRGEVKKAFNPEFLNRLDEVILFTSLTDDDLIQIIDLLVDQINVNLVAKQIKIRLTPDAAKYILEKTCGDRSYGARPLRRALQKYIEDPLSEALIQGTLPRPAELEVYLGDTGIYYRQVNVEGEDSRFPRAARSSRPSARCSTRSKCWSGNLGRSLRRPALFSFPSQASCYSSVLSPTPGITAPVLATAIGLAGAALGLWLTGLRRRARIVVPFSAGVLLGVALFGLLPELACRNGPGSTASSSSPPATGC